MPAQSGLSAKVLVGWMPVWEWVGKKCRDFLRICWQQGEILGLWKGHSTFFQESLALGRLTQKSAFFGKEFLHVKKFD
jgi:hypothetical protein